MMVKSRENHIPRPGPETLAVPAATSAPSPAAQATSQAVSICSGQRQPCPLSIAILSPACSLLSAALTYLPWIPRNQCRCTPSCAIPSAASTIIRGIFLHSVSDL